MSLRTGGATDTVNAKSSVEDPKVTGEFVSGARQADEHEAAACHRGWTSVSAVFFLMFFTFSAVVEILAVFSFFCEIRRLLDPKSEIGHSLIVLF